MSGITIPGDWNDWRWGGFAVNPPGPIQGATLTDLGDCYAYVFADNSLMAFPDLQLPHDYKEGTDLLPHIHWSPTTSGTYEGVWTLELRDYLSAATGTMPVDPGYLSDLSFGPTVYTAGQMVTMSFPNDLLGVIAGVTRRISSIVHARLLLTLTQGAGAILNGLDAHYQQDRFGSVTPTSKTGA